MGKVTGFLEIDRHDRDYAPVADRMRHYQRIRHSAGEEANARRRRRAAWIAAFPIASPWPGHRLPGEQPDPGLERPRLSRATGRRPRATCTRPTISRSSPAASARRRARLLHAEHRRQAGHHQDDRMRHRRPRLGEGWIKPEPAVAQDRQEGRRRRLGPGGPRLRAAARARRPRRASSTRRRPRPAACCATASPTSRWRSTIVDRRVDADGSRRRDLPLRRQCRRRRCRSTSLLDELRRGGAGRRRRKAARPADPRPRARRRPFRDGFPAAAEPPRAGEEPLATPRRSSPPASMSWSSAAATPAPTASAPRSARARCRSPSSRSCRSRPRRRTSC